MVPETVLSTAAPHRPFYRTAGILIQRERPPGSPVLRVTLFLCGLRTENLVADPWAMSAVPDFVYAETTGKPPEDLEQRLKFQKGLSQLAAQEAAVFEMLVEVRHLLKPLKLLEDPAIADRINREVSSEVSLRMMNSRILRTNLRRGHSQSSFRKRWPGKGARHSIAYLLCVNRR
jgi:hypothetical protein